MTLHPDSVLPFTKEDIVRELETGAFETSASGKIILATKVASGFGAVNELFDHEVNGVDHEGFAPADVGRALERELRLLLCTSDKKYEDLRQELSRARQSAKQGGMLIATAIAAKWHLSAALLTPFVLVFLLGILDLSVQAWCAGKSVESL